MSDLPSDSMWLSEEYGTHHLVAFSLPLRLAFLLPLHLASLLPPRLAIDAVGFVVLHIRVLTAVHLAF